MWKAGVLWARRKKVVEAAAQRAQATAEWLESHEFMPQAELSSWVDVVSHRLPAQGRLSVSYWILHRQPLM